MEVVDVWTGSRANALQRAFRLSNEAFAERLGTAVRTVAHWSARPDVEPVGQIQEALDTLLYLASDQVKARFAMLVDKAERAVGEQEGVNGKGNADIADAERRLSVDSHIGGAIEWLDRCAEWPAGTSRRKAATELAAMDSRALQDRGHRRARVSQRQAAQALADYYKDDLGDFGTYQAAYGDGRKVRTSILTQRAWLDLGCPLDTEHDRLRLTSVAAETPTMLNELVAEGAIRRIAESLAAGSPIVNSPLYRLLSADIEPGRLDGEFGLTTFVHYALTMDLLEGELVDALSEGRSTERGSLPLRDSLLPDVASVINTANRMCAGGALALCAVARPADRSRRGVPDYMLLVQERSGRVLNAAQRLAVIPKGFHQPLVDYDHDTQVGATLRREMEEELFGRDDVDSTIGSSRHADPMHPSRLSGPMKWLGEHDEARHWRMESTGFGLNLVSGNFEFASLIVIDDEEFWSQYGGHIAANWESDGLRQYSTMDSGQLAELIGDPAWSNEGLFALLQGLRRLAEIGNNRVRMPTIEWEIS